MQRRQEAIDVHLIEIFLPLNTNDGSPQPAGLLHTVREEMIQRFGGVTAFTRSPAKGISVEEGDGRAEDDIVVYEVMVQSLDGAWWSTYKRELEQRFQQREVLIRAMPLELVN
jgi:hypothetical protein